MSESICCPHCGAALDRPAAERYRLDVTLSGRPISTNRYHDAFVVQTRQRGQMIIRQHSSSAARFLAHAEQQTCAAIDARAASVPHPRDWPRPLRLSVYVRSRAVDLDNTLKVPLDGIKRALGVDDKAYEFGEIVRERGPQGMRFVIESAPLDTAADTAAPSAAEQPIARRRATATSRSLVSKPHTAHAAHATTTPASRPVSSRPTATVRQRHARASSRRSASQH